MKTRHEYGNKPEYSEIEEETSADDKFKADNVIAKAAFLIDQQHDAVLGNESSGRDQAEPAVETVLHTDVIDRCNGALNNRRNGAAIDRRIGTS